MQRANFQATCGACGKLGYTAKSKAKDALRRTKNAGSVAVKPGAALRVYACDTEGGRNGLYHVGHKRTQIGANWNDGTVRFLPGEGGCVA
jgi:hypothetical protein